MVFKRNGKIAESSEKRRKELYREDFKSNLFSTLALCLIYIILAAYYRFEQSVINGLMLIFLMFETGNFLTRSLKSVKNMMLWGIVPVVMVEIMLGVDTDMRRNVMSVYLAVVFIVCIGFMAYTFKKYMLDEDKTE